ncbi:cation/H(+) antiporter 15-like isoform X1 [Typha latifolia]|uniref:cation/H(+) antiporter 15-like isoform X1 n=1 Tax=Typha latifolia TaxID=4733 RepID=UPI003C2BE688
MEEEFPFMDSGPQAPPGAFMGALVGDEVSNDRFELTCSMLSETWMLSNGLWHRMDRQNFLWFYVSRLLVQLVLIVFVCRLLHLLLRPLRQPRIICDIIAGLLLGPAVKIDTEELFDFFSGIKSEHGRSVHVTLAATGLIFNLFVAAVKMDPTMIWRSGKKPVPIGIVSLFFPLAMVILSSYAVMDQLISILKYKGQFFIFMAASVCTTAFPVLADILAELRLLNTELGRLALSSAMIQGVIGWFFALVFTAVNQSQNGWLKGILALICYGVMLLFVAFVFRPYVRWIVRTTPADGRVSELHVFVIIMMVLGMAIATDAMGATIIDGPMILGLAIPDGPPLGAALVERLDLLATEVLLPLLFLYGGFIADVPAAASQGTLWMWLQFIMLVAYVSKVVGAMVPAVFCNIPVQKAFMLGLMMNFRGLMEMIIFLAFRNGMLLNRETYTMLIISTVGVTAVCAPVVAHFYKPLSGSNYPMARRTVQHRKSQAELRVLACFSDEAPLPAILDLLECCSSVHSRSSLCVYPLHLVELHGRAASTLISHRDSKGLIDTSQMDRIHNNFIAFEEGKKGAATVIPFTSIAPRKSMHHDICSLALDKDATFIVIPYPRRDDATNVDADVGIRAVVPLVLSQAPCSVGILIHNSSAPPVTSTPDQWQYLIAVFFWGGPDDREALSIASRMAQHPGVGVTVVRFTSMVNQSRDDEVVGRLRAQNAGNNRVVINEVMANNVEETVSVIREVGNEYDLVVVGRQQGPTELLYDGLAEWNESPELGLVGDLLASQDFHSSFAILVVQQHAS